MQNKSISYILLVVLSITCLVNNRSINAEVINYSSLDDEINQIISLPVPNKVIFIEQEKISGLITIKYQVEIEKSSIKSIEMVLDDKGLIIYYVESILKNGEEKSRKHYSYNESKLSAIYEYIHEDAVKKKYRSDGELVYIIERDFVEKPNLIKSIKQYGKYVDNRVIINLNDEYGGYFQVAVEDISKISFYSNGNLIKEEYVSTCTGESILLRKIFKNGKLVKEEPFYKTGVIERKKDLDSYWCNIGSPTIIYYTFLLKILFSQTYRFCMPNETHGEY